VKIIQCISSLKKTSGGTTFFVSDLSNELAKYGVDVTLVSQFSKNKSTNLKDLNLPLEKKYQTEITPLNW
jgi:hypothetical protein